MSSIKPDPFDHVLGNQRGSDREPSKDPEVIGGRERRRNILARIAAHGILAHNTAVDMPQAYTPGRVAALVEHGADGSKPFDSEVTPELRTDLAALLDVGYLSVWEDAYKVTPAGLFALWTQQEMPW